LGLNDLLVAVGADFDHALVVLIAGMGNAQNVLPGRNRFQNDAA